MTWNSLSCVLVPWPTPNLLVERRASSPGRTGETPVPPSLSNSWVQPSAYDRRMLRRFKGVARKMNGAVLVGLEFNQPRGNKFRQKAFLVTVGSFDRCVNLAFAKRSSSSGSKRAGLIAGGVESQPTVSHRAG